MSVNHPQFGTFCCICFTGLTPDTCATDTTGRKWDVCKGLCAQQAGITEACECDTPGPDVIEADKGRELACGKCRGQFTDEKEGD